MKKQKEYENEIRFLNETIQRLENHLAEQSKAVAEVIAKSFHVQALSRLRLILLFQGTLERKATRKKA